MTIFLSLPFNRLDSFDKDKWNMQSLLLNLLNSNKPETNSVWLEKFDVLRWIRAQTQPGDHPMTWSERSVTHKYVTADQWFVCMQQLATYITQWKRILLLWPVSYLIYHFIPAPYTVSWRYDHFLFALYLVYTTASKVFYVDIETLQREWNFPSL